MIRKAAPSHRLGSIEIYCRLRDQIVSGVYKIGEKIPSSRALAIEFGVSRTTVCIAYERLVAEGYVVVRQGARSRVSADFPMPHPLQSVSTRTQDDGSRMSAYGRYIDAAVFPSRHPRKHLAIDFYYGEMASDDFPSRQWRRALLKTLPIQNDVLAYGDPEGSCALRRALQGYLWRARSINCRLEQIVIVSGSQQALDLLARILLNREDIFVIENPCYAMARLAFEATGAKPHPIGVDAFGIDTSKLGDVRARLAYVTPSHQYPLGGVLPIERRLELVAWSKKVGSWIVEDDYDSEYRYDGASQVPLWSVADTDRVLYVGTISKSLSPTLRIGYVVLPDALRDVFIKAKQLADRHTAVHEQDALAVFIHEGSYERHVRRQRRENHRRRTAMVEALRLHLGPRAEVEGTEAGLHLVVWLRDLPASREEELILRARALGVGLHSIRPLCDPPLAARRGAQAGLLMGYASLTSASIAQGVGLLRQALDMVETPSPGCQPG